MKILGNNVYLDYPPIKESAFSISEELKKELALEQAAKFERLVVFDVGAEVKGDTYTLHGNNQYVKPGDEVFIDPFDLQRSLTVDIDGNKKIVIPFGKILHVW